MRTKRKAPFGAFLVRGPLRKRTADRFPTFRFGNYMKVVKMSSNDIPDDQLSKAIGLLSVERMGVYSAITANERDAIDLHCQMLRVAAALMPVTALIEICLRNAVCEALRAQFKTADWLNTPPAPFVWRGEERKAIRRAIRHARRAAYAKLSQHQKKRLDRIAFPQGLPAGLSHEDRVRERQKIIAITFGQQVAQLTLGFWKRLFSADYDSALWNRSLKRLFPDRSLTRSMIAENLETVYQARNRIAHHEPMYGKRLQAVTSAIDFLTTKFGYQIDGGQTLLEIMTGPHCARLIEEATTLGLAVESFTIQISDADDR